MIGSFLTRGLVMVFGYAYPAYECYKTVEKNKPEIEQLRFWCQYWILVAVLTVCERVGDAFVSWVPMYSEAKLAFFIYLWYPKTKGTTYVYDSFFRPYVAKHETEIDRNLLELRTRAGDMAVLYCQRVVSYGQSRIFEILQYVAAQSTPKPRAPKPQQQESVPKSRQASSGIQLNMAPKSQPEPKEPPSPTDGSSSEPKDSYEWVDPPQPKEASAPNTQKIAVPPENSAPTKPTADGACAMEVQNADPLQSLTEAEAALPKETLLEETTRVTRGRLRKTRSAGTQ